MSSLQNTIEKNMNKYLVKKAPFQIPNNGKKAIAEWAPWIVLVFGILSVLSALSLWGLARQAGNVIDSANDFSRAYGVEPAVENVSAVVYLTIVVVAAQGVILLAAFKGLQDRSKKKGWDLLLLGVVLGFVYSVITIFLDSYYRGSANFLISLAGALVGLYVLAQIKDQYKDAGTAKK